MILAGRTGTLYELALARSGDKGNHANIAVLARRAGDFPWLRDWLTAARVQAFFAELGWPCRQVAVFPAENIHALNFMLYDGLDGGAARSLRIDTQGKTFASLLLTMPINDPPKDGKK